MQNAYRLRHFCLAFSFFCTYRYFVYVLWRGLKWRLEGEWIQVNPCLKPHCNRALKTLTLKQSKGSKCNSFLYLLAFEGFFSSLQFAYTFYNVCEYSNYHTCFAYWYANWVHLGGKCLLFTQNWGEARSISGHFYHTTIDRNCKHATVSHIPSSNVVKYNVEKYQW